MNSVTKLSIERNVFSYAVRMHPNPRFFKYYWWIFSMEADEYVRNPRARKGNRLSTKNAMDLLESLKGQNENIIIHNIRFPRKDILNPFNTSCDKWKKVDWAPSLDEDMDEIWRGYK